jgi:phenylpyruvate tautomerase PptA (4-oxalocrotonate tautomerase family)
MPLVRIDLNEGKPAEYRQAIGEVIYEAMVATMNVPKDDRFMIIAEHPPGNLIADPGYLGIRRTSDCILIQLTLNQGRTLDQKKAFYKAVADGLAARLALRGEGVFISLVEVPKENWSMGNGLAPYAP